MAHNETLLPKDILMNVYLRTLKNHPDVALNIVLGAPEHIKSRICNRSETITTKELLLELAATDNAVEIIKIAWTDAQLEALEPALLDHLWEYELAHQRTLLKK
jgi:hypothetical protein